MQATLTDCKVVDLMEPMITFHSKKNYGLGSALV
jgi:hypothetical protein